MIEESNKLVINLIWMFTDNDPFYLVLWVPAPDFMESIEYTSMWACRWENKHFCKEVVASTAGFMPVSLSEIRARVMG